MIYGNPNAKSESNGNAVFELFDVQGIVGFWHMDEPQWTGAIGEVKDETGVNHGTAYSGATTTSDAIYGRAGYFDGEDDYVEVLDNDSLDITDAITVEVWLKHFSRTDINPRIVVKQPVNYAYLMWFENENDRVGFRIKRESDLTHNTAFASHTPDSLWHYFVGTYDGTDIKIYKDGVLKETVNFPGTIHTTDGNLVIGGKQDGSQQFYGVIDEVRIYKRALTPTEIEILYNNYMQKMGSYFNVRKYVTPAPVVIV